MQKIVIVGGVAAGATAAANYYNFLHVFYMLLCCYFLFKPIPDPGNELGQALPTGGGRS